MTYKIQNLDFQYQAVVRRLGKKVKSVRRSVAGLWFTFWTGPTFGR